MNQKVFEDTVPGHNGSTFKKDSPIRRSELDCESDGFLPLKNMKLPESSEVLVDRTMNLMN